MQHIIEEIYQEALNDELNKLAGIEKVALSGKTLASYARKRETQNVVLGQARRALHGYKDLATRSESAIDLGAARNKINAALKQSRAKMSTGPIREAASSASVSNKISKADLRQAMKDPVVNYKHPGVRKYATYS